MKEDLLEETFRNNIVIVAHSNIKDQMFIWIEEMSELTKVICKWARRYDELNGDLTGDLKQDFLTEIADVTVCLDQIKYAVKIFEDEVLEEYKYKVDRQLDRMKEEK
jgi:hypothetical protein